jgi:hypothetical protein
MTLTIKAMSLPLKLMEICCHKDFFMEEAYQVCTAYQWKQGCAVPALE